MSESDHDRWFRAQVQAALDKPNPRFTPADEVAAWLRALVAAKIEREGQEGPASGRTATSGRRGLSSPAMTERSRDT